MHKSERHGFNWFRGESMAYRRAMVATARLAASGIARPITRYAWAVDRKPFCDSPVPISHEKPGRDAGAPVQLNMFGPCRKCAKCLLFRQMKWRQRAINELILTHNSGRRSWWITLTFSPVHLAGVLAEAVAEAGIADTRSIDRAAYKHVQGYLDRLRKRSRTRLRYLAVYERGEETGRSHYHLLIHEVGPRPILKRQIEICWRSHVHARLVHIHSRSTGLATYITKYATKHVEVRPRASSYYGTGPKPVANRAQRKQHGATPRGRA